MSEDVQELVEVLSQSEVGPGRALLEATCAMGFSQPVARSGLAAELGAWADASAFQRLADRAAAVAEVDRPRTVLLIAAGTLPASTLRHVLMARLLGAKVLLKSASGQASVGEALASASAAIESWEFSRDEPSFLRAAIDRVDSVVALGSDASLAQIEGHVPFHKTFVGYGHRVSGLWLNEAPQSALVGAARDLLMWDQAGCLSPQVLWTSGNPREVASRLTGCVAALESEFPMRLGKWAACDRRVARTLGHMRGQVFSTASADVIALDEPIFRVSARGRQLWVLPQDTQALREVLPRLSTLGIHGVAPMEFAGHVRTCQPGMMQSPGLDWRQDGRDPLLALCRAS